MQLGRGCVIGLLEELLKVSECFLVRMLVNSLSMRKFKRRELVYEDHG